MKKKTEIIIVILGITAIVFAIFMSKKASAPIINNQQIDNTKTVTTPITIKEQAIKEENFTGSKSVISGSGELADNARSFIEDAVASFKQSADEDVPDMRKQFGNDAPTGKYEIVLKATYLKNSKVESIVIDQYVYTGGANGSSSYKVYNISVATGKSLLLSDIIASDKQDEFVALMKKKLLSWKPEGFDSSPVFKDEVSSLTFDSFANWSMNDKSLVIYFDKYEIGPGVLGAVMFPVPLAEVKGLLTTNY